MLHALLLLLATHAATDAPVEVVLHQLEHDRWRAEYRFDEPVEALRFVRRPPFRVDEWTVATEGLELVRLDRDDFVVGDKPFTRLTLELPTNTDWLLKDYELVNRYTDGGLIFYTGHLDVYPVKRGANGDWVTVDRYRGGPRPTVRYRFEPLPETSVRIPGGGGDYASNEHGVYVYFGSAEPIATDDVLAIVDPGLPPHLRATFDAYLPRLFALYEDQLGHTLSQRPTIYFTARQGDGNGYSTHGGVTGGVVQLTVEADFANPPQQLEERLIHLIAHESAHLWNGNAFRHDHSAGSSWLHEGSADVLAELALTRLGYYDQDQLMTFAERQATECARGLSRMRLFDAADQQRFDLMYSCGAVIAHLTDAAVGEQSLFDFWARLFDTASATGEYTAADYFALVWELGGREAADTIYRLVHEQHEDSFEFVRQALVAAGFKVEVEIGPAADDISGSARALSHLMGQDCKGSYSIYTETDVLKIAGVPGCAHFENEVFYPVTHVAGHPVTDGAGVDDAIARLCGTDDPVPLTLQDGADLAVPCAKPWVEDRRRVRLSR